MFDAKTLENLELLKFMSRDLFVYEQFDSEKTQQRQGKKSLYKTCCNEPYALLGQRGTVFTKVRTETYAVISDSTLFDLL